MNLLVTYQLRKNEVFEYNAKDLKDELTASLCTFIGGCKLSPDGNFFFKYIGWTVLTEIDENNDTLSIKIFGYRKCNKCMLSNIVGYIILGMAELFICPPLGLFVLCMAIGAACDHKGEGIIKLFKRKLKTICKKHGMTIVR